MATVLYVDDEEAIGRAVARWFGRRGHTVLLATSVASAQQQLVGTTPDVLFLDVWLGHESGFELMGWLEDVRPELAGRVTFVTGESADAGRAEPGWRTLGRPVLQKPFEFAQLARVAEEADARAAVAAAPSPPDAERRAGT